MQGIHWWDVLERRVRSVLVVVLECLGYDGLRLLVVGKVVRPDVLAPEASMECLYVTILLRCMCPDELEVDAQDGGPPLPPVIL